VNIDGAATAILNRQYLSIQVQYSGSEWFVI
jgi:hypothetical protein